MASQVQLAKCWLSRIVTPHLTNITQGRAAGPSAGGLAEKEAPLLGVTPKLLKGEDELRRIFGSSVVAEEAREARQGAYRDTSIHMLQVLIDLYNASPTPVLLSRRRSTLCK